MTRRPVLPGASELFRRTDTPPAAPEVTELPSIPATTSSPALRGSRRADEAAETTQQLTLVPGGQLIGDLRRPAGPLFDATLSAAVGTR